MSEKYTLQKYYISYLRDVKKVSETTVRQYQNALNNVSRFLKRENKIEQTIYEILDINELEELRSFLYQNTEFLEQNQRGHRMYSSGLNNYLEFANGEVFLESKDSLPILDAAMPVVQKDMKNQKIWKRSTIIKKQTMQQADYLCEIDAAHKTFIAESTKQQYMEGHHAIPMHLQDKFQYSLDIYANVVCLCPICHRLLHHGIKAEKMFVLNKVYDDRVERLVKSGIKISKEEFLELA